MEALFLKLLNMSISASWLVLFVIAVRFLVKKAPRALVCLLWLAVGIRLVCPFSIESVFSLVPTAEPIPPEIIYSENTQMGDGTVIGDILPVTPPVSDETVTPPLVTLPEEPVQTLPKEDAVTLLGISSLVWSCGVVLMLSYMLISYIVLRMRVRVSVVSEKGVMLCDSIESPFILGFVKPRIYIPSAMPSEQVTFVLAHEKAHIKRRDYIWKPLGFLLLSVYWFNPVMWLAYILLCKDIELACDEKVISLRGDDYKREYSNTLLSCSMPKKIISACPLAFGEVGVKERIKNVMSYKKPTLWIIIASLLALTVAAVCFLTNPKKDVTDEAQRQHDFDELTVLDASSTFDGISVWITKVEGNLITVEWKNESGRRAFYGNPFGISVYGEDGEVIPLESDVVFTMPAYELRHGSTAKKTYDLSLFPIEKGNKYRFVASFHYEEGYKNLDGSVYINFYLKTDEDKNLGTMPPEKSAKDENYAFVAPAREESSRVYPDIPYEYIYERGGFLMDAHLSLSADGRATLLCGYMLKGSYKKTEKELVIIFETPSTYAKSYGDTVVYTFTNNGNGYTFNQKKSSYVIFTSVGSGMVIDYFPFVDGVSCKPCGRYSNGEGYSETVYDIDGDGNDETVAYKMEYNYQTTSYAGSIQTTTRYFGGRVYLRVYEGDFLEAIQTLGFSKNTKKAEMYTDSAGKLKITVTHNNGHRVELNIKMSEEKLCFEKNGLLFRSINFSDDEYLVMAAYGEQIEKIAVGDFNYDGKNETLYKGMSNESGRLALFVCADGWFKGEGIYYTDLFEDVRVERRKGREETNFYAVNEDGEARFDMTIEEGRICLYYKGEKQNESIQSLKKEDFLDLGYDPSDRYTLACGDFDGDGKQENLDIAPKNIGDVYSFALILSEDGDDYSDEGVTLYSTKSFEHIKYADLGGGKFELLAVDDNFTAAKLELKVDGGCPYLYFKGAKLENEITIDQSEFSGANNITDYSHIKGKISFKSDFDGDGAIETVYAHTEEMDGKHVSILTMYEGDKFEGASRYCAYSWITGIEVYKYNSDKISVKITSSYYGNGSPSWVTLKVDRGAPVVDMSLLKPMP